MKQVNLIMLLAVILLGVASSWGFDMPAASDEQTIQTTKLQQVKTISEPQVQQERTFLLRDLGNGATVIMNEAAADKAYAPLATFDLPLSLLQAEREATTQTVSSQYPSHEAWQQAMVALTPREKLQHTLSSLDYGNQNMGQQGEAFWQDGSLTITPREQIDFLTALFRGELPYKEAIIERVKKEMILWTQENMTFAGITAADHAQGWFIGYIALPDHSYVYAAHVTGQGDHNGSLAREWAEGILREMKLLPPTDKNNQ